MGKGFSNWKLQAFFSFKGVFSGCSMLFSCSGFVWLTVQGHLLANNPDWTHDEARWRSSSKQGGAERPGKLRRIFLGRLRYVSGDHIHEIFTIGTLLGLIRVERGLTKPDSACWKSVPNIYIR